MRAVASDQRGGEGGRDGAVVRALPSQQCGLWFEFVVGSRPCSEGFSPGSPVFLHLLKPTLPNSNSTRAHGHLSIEFLSGELFGAP